MGRPHKRCNTCHRDLPLDQFHKHNSNADGRFGCCKGCHYARQREWVERNKDKTRGYIRKNRIKRKYGLTVAEYDAAIARDCAICGASEDICLDHDHDTGAVRSALCSGCNKALGYMGDDPERLRAAADYLEEHSCATPTA